jgi:hypothetical protein
MRHARVGYEGLVEVEDDREDGRTYAHHGWVCLRALRYLLRFESGLPSEGLAAAAL